MLRFVLLVLLCLFSLTLLGEDCSKCSKYTPPCFDNRPKCQDSRNIAFLGFGQSTLNGMSQKTYGAGYMRLIRTKGGEDLAIGAQALGAERDGLFAGQILVGYGW